MRRLPFVIAALALVLVACPKKRDEAAAAKARVFGKDLPTPEVEKRAAEPIDARGLANDPAAARRAWSMPWEELVVRMGIVEYRGAATINVARGRPSFAVTEDSVITQGLGGSFRMYQKDGEGHELREAYFNNGVFFISNGGGQMRVEGMVRDRPVELRQELWSPLSTFLRYYGPRVGLAPAGEVNVGGRAGIKYTLVLIEGPESVDAQDGDTPKVPRTLEGYLVFDVDKGAPIEAKFKGELDVPTPDHAQAGKIALALNMRVAPVDPVDLVPKKFIPGIERHPLEPAPLAFLDGGTRTSTVIGGRRPVPPPPEPEPEEP